MFQDPKPYIKSYVGQDDVRQTSEPQPLIKSFQPDRLFGIGAVHSLVSESSAQFFSTSSQHSFLKLSQEQFLQQVVALAEQLPDEKYCINLCRDRYFFILLFCALIVKRSINVLPSNDKPCSIKQVASEYSELICISDRVLGDDYAEVSEEIGQPCLNLIDLLGDITPATCDMPMIELDRVVAITYTSGTTGRPQPNQKLWGTLAGTAKLLGRRFLQDPVSNGQIKNSELSDQKKSQPPVLVATVPPQHMYGLETSVMMTLQCSCAFFFGKTFYPSDIEEAFSIVDEGVLITTPVHLSTLDKASRPFLGIKKVISATAPLFPELCSAIEQRYNTVVEEIYGFTEAGSVATRKSASESEWTLLQGMQLHKRTGKTDGNIVVTGPQLFEEKAVHDLIEIGVEGCSFKLVGRSQDMLNVAGKRISLSELNQKLLAIDAIQDAVMVMPETDSVKQRPVAIVVSSIEKISKRDIQQILAGQVDPVFVPRKIIFVEKIPRNDTGKPQKQALMEIVDAS